MRLIEVNDAGCRMTGCSREELSNMTPRNFNQETGPDYLKGIIEELKDKEHINFKKVIVTKDNGRINVEVSSHIFRLNEKKLMIEIVRDITQRKKAEQLIIEGKDEAEAANKAKSEFLANMSHEICTPINGIDGMIDITLTTELNSIQIENLSIAKTCANSLLTIINDILDFSKMEAGKLKLEGINFNIKQLIEDIIKSHSPIAYEKRIDLNYMFSSNIPEFLVGDPNRLQQILNNLINNAIKFTREGNVTVSVKGGEVIDGNIDLKFSVSNTGIGISHDDMNKLFKSFSQVDGSQTRKYQGTGLGLAISKQLIELILRILEEKGHCLDIANNGVEALALHEPNDYDVILMDIQMPEMDGVEATKIIREFDTFKKSIY